LETQLILSEKLDYLTGKTANELLENCSEISKLLSGLLNSLSPRH
jgi:four helix bundle protein